MKMPFFLYLFSYKTRLFKENIEKTLQNQGFHVMVQKSYKGIAQNSQ